ncbi:PBECR3 domain-containing polyvalent protein, partial [Campylobacter lanienae]
MAEFILLNKVILNANGDFKLAIKNIDNIPDGNLPTPTRNLLNEFKEAVKEIEKQVVKADNQPNLANQANSGNIDSLTKQISYLQNAIKNQSKDAPTPSTAIKQEVDSLSQATPNLTQNSIKGDGFVTYPNSARQIYPHNAIFEVPNEIRQIADIGDRVSASLEWLRSNHPEMFKTQRAVKEVIDYVLKEPENIVSPKKGDGVILSKQNDKKMDEIGINQNSEVFHANKRKLNSNEKKAVSGDALPPHLDADNISLTGRYSVGGKPHLTANEPMAETPKSQRKQQVLGVQMNTSKEHFSSANAETIPNQTIKEAETMAKTAEPTAEPKTAENTQGNSKILTNQDIKEQISKWDLNAPKQTLITNKIDGEELEKLNEHFKFKGNYPLTRQIDSEHIKHALNHHGDEKIEALRGQKAITLDDISNYENYAKTADIKEYSDKKVISKKQINGHFVVVEEALTGKNRLNFVSMWYVKGKIKDVAPVSTPKNDLDRTLSNRYDSSNSTPKEIKSQEPTPQAKADEANINPKSNYKKHERPIELD